MIRLAGLFILAVALVWPFAWNGTAMAAPAFQAAGTAVGGTGAVSPAWPAHAVDDIALLFIESRGEQAATLSTAAGFVAVANSPQFTGTTTAGTRLTVFWARATSAAMAAPTVADPGDHVIAQILTYRGVINTGNPWDVTGGGVKAAASAAVSATGVTTTVPGTLVVVAVAQGRDANSTATFSGWANPSLTGITEQSDSARNNGDGGGFGIMDGVMAAAGATGNTTATMTNSFTNAFLTIALKPPPPPPPAVSSINRADPNPTAAASVSWTVTFNASVSGVNSGNFTPVPSGLGGAPAVTGVSGSGTTWTVTASTGTGAGTLGLNMTNTTGVSPAITNLPFTGQVYSVRPTYYYHDTTNGVNIGFDGPTNVTSGANQVIPPIITASLITANTCTGNARSNNHPAGLYTHSRWYLTADYAVATDIGANPTGSASLRGQAATDTVIVSLYDYDPVSGAKILIGSSTAITLTGGGTTTTYPYTISSSLYTVPAGRRLMLEYNFSQPVATDNARVYCSATAAYIAVTETPATVAVADHFSVNHSGTGVTCQAEPITVAAHDAAHGIFTTQTAGITLSTSTGLGDWSLISGGGTLTPGAVNSGSAVYVFAAGDNGQVTLGLKHTAAASVSLGVTDGTATLTTGTGMAEVDSPVVYSDAGFSVTDSAGNPVNIGSQIAGQTSGTLYLQAVKTAPNGACTGVFNTTVNIEMASQCNNPAACAGRQVTVNATALNVGYPNSTVPGGSGLAGVNVPLAFGANSIAPFTLNYPDVGQIKLYARYNMPLRGGTPSGNYMVGNSNSFVVKPGGFALSGIMRTRDSFANPAAAAATGNAFVKAGEAFTATVTATTIDGVTAAPNYGQEATPESVKLTSALVGGLGLTNNPAVGGTFGAFSNGVATGTAFTWGEVGIITLTPSVADADYLAAGDIAGSTSGNVGRFYPHHFALSASSITNRVQSACAPASTFTYAGEQLQTAFTLTAQNLSDVTTVNYATANSFAKLDGTVIANFNFGAIDLADAVAPLPATPNLSLGLVSSSGTWSAGVGAFTADLGLNRAAQPDGPYESFNLGIAPVDSDAVSLASYDLDVNGDASADHGLIGASKIRYGRLKLSNAHGSELLDLPLPIETQYWNGTAFATNTGDNCTTLNPANILPGNYQGGISAINMGASHVNFSGPFSAGRGNLRLAKPSPTPNGKGSVDVTVDLSPAAENKTYLQGAWSGAPYSENPSARATFGVYSSPNNFIYFRENY